MILSQMETKTKAKKKQKKQAPKKQSYPLQFVRKIFTPQKDADLTQIVNTHGTKSWMTVAALLNQHFPPIPPSPPVTARQCRDRWCNYLAPELTMAAWTAQEDEQLLKLHTQYGNQWSTLARLLNKSSESAVKNRYKTLCRKQGDAHHVIPQTIFRGPLKDSMYLKDAPENLVMLQCHVMGGGHPLYNSFMHNSIYTVTDIESFMQDTKKLLQQLDSPALGGLDEIFQQHKADFDALV